MPEIHAHSLDPHAAGFYFEGPVEFSEKAKANRNEFGNRVEEYELQFIDGTWTELALFQTMRVNQARLNEYFDTLTELERRHGEDNDHVAAVLWALEDVYARADGDSVLQVVTDGSSVLQGDMLDYAHHYIDSTGHLDAAPDFLARYFDYNAFARDLEMEGNLHEIKVNGTPYIVELYA